MSVSPSLPPSCQVHARVPPRSSLEARPTAFDWWASNGTAFSWPMRSWSSFSKAPRSRDWFETSSMTRPDRPTSPSGRRYFRGLRCSHGRNSIGKPASRESTAARLLGRKSTERSGAACGRPRTIASPFLQSQDAGAQLTVQVTPPESEFHWSV